MAKKKKKKQNAPKRHVWKIPEPNPGQGKNPDLGNHLMELLNSFAAKQAGRSGFSRLSDERIKAMTTYTSIYQQYLNRLQALPEYKSREDLMALDRIDLSGVIDAGKSRENDRLGDDLSAWLEKIDHVFYACIPCFETGVLLHSRNRITYFEIRNLDLDAERITLFLRDYMASGTTEHMEPGISFTVTMDAHLENGMLSTGFAIDENAVENFTNLYSRISAFELRWGPYETAMWEQVILQNAADQLARFQALNTSPAAQLSQKFCHSIIMSNFCLSNHRPKLEKPEPGDRSPERASSAGTATPHDPNAPRVRTVGTVKFVSTRAPKCPTAKTVRQYTVASWPTRGHMRTYKSGKTVWVKPTVHYRKALNGKAPSADASGAQQIIVVRDNRPNNE